MGLLQESAVVESFLRFPSDILLTSSEVEACYASNERIDFCYIFVMENINTHGLEIHKIF